MIVGPIAGSGFEGLIGVVGSWRIRLDLRDGKVRVPGNGDPDHLDPIRHRRSIAALVRGLAGNDKPDLIQRQRFPARLGKDQMTQVDRIEGAAEQT